MWTMQHSCASRAAVCVLYSIKRATLHQMSPIFAHQSRAFCQKSPTFSSKRLTFSSKSLENALPSVEPPILPSTEPPIVFFIRVSHSNNSYNLSESKEPYAPWKEPYTPSKEPYILSKVHDMVLIDPSSCWKLALYSVIRALHSDERVLHFSDRAMPSVDRALAFFHKSRTFFHMTPIFFHKGPPFTITLHPYVNTQIFRLVFLLSGIAHPHRWGRGNRSICNLQHEWSDSSKSDVAVFAVYWGMVHFTYHMTSLCSITYSFSYSLCPVM